MKGVGVAQLMNASLFASVGPVIAGYIMQVWGLDIPEAVMYLLVVVAALGIGAVLAIGNAYVISTALSGLAIPTRRAFGMLTWLAGFSILLTAGLVTAGHLHAHSGAVAGWLMYLVAVDAELLVAAAFLAQVLKARAADEGAARLVAGEGEIERLGEVISQLEAQVEAGRAREREMAEALRVERGERRAERLAKMGERAREVFKILEQGPADVPALERETGAQGATLRNALEDLVKADLVVKVPAPVGSISRYFFEVKNEGA